MLANKNDFKLMEWTVNNVNIKKNPIFSKKKLNVTDPKIKIIFGFIILIWSNIMDL